MHVSLQHQLRALTYVLYLQSSITALSSQWSENTGLVLNGLSWSSSCLGLMICVASSRVFAVVYSPCSLAALIFLNVQRSDINWCVFWRPAALSTAMPPVCTSTMQNASGRQRGKGGQGRVGHCTLFYRVMQRKDRQRDRDRERGRNCGGRVTASVASQCPRQEERELCAADCLTETLAAGWWHFMVTTCNPTNSLAGENPVFKHWMALDSCCYSRTKNDTLLHLF